MKIKQVLGVVLLLWMPTLAAAEITVERAWLGMPPAAADSAGAYLVLSNHGDTDVTITSIETDVAATVECYSIIFLEGTVLKQKMAAPVVPAHGQLKLSPGGNHLLLQDLNRELNAGDTVLLKLNTANGTSITAHATVRGKRKPQH